jgi:hypothetical protein
MSLTADANDTRRPTVAKRPDPFDSFIKAVMALAPIITALTGAVVAGHNIGWW